MTAEVQTAGAAPGRRRRRSNRPGILFAQVAILIVLVSAWEFAVSQPMLPYFSRPSLIAAKLGDLLSHEDIYRHISVTLLEIALGYSIGAVVGLTLGFILGRSKFLSAALQPYIIGLYSIPK